MKRSGAVAVLFSSGIASAGGLLLPGAGVVSTTRAGAAVASADDAEAITLNPAGIAKSTGTVITFGAVAIDYMMSFTRAGTYDPIAEESVSYAGQAYPKVTNASKPPLGIGSYQPVPLVGVVSDLGNRIKGLHVGVSVYAPNAYPFRDMNNVNGKAYFTKDSKTGAYSFPTTFGSAPPPSRYDIIAQQAAIVLPTAAVAYRILPNLDVGGRFSAGFATLESTQAVWGLQNYEEYNKADGLVTIDATAKFVHTFGFGATYRPTANIELAANYSAPIDLHAKGTVYSANGPAVSVGGVPVAITPTPDQDSLCEKGGTAAALKGCVDIELPQTATIAGRWKFLDTKTGKERGDVELDLGWENWGASCNYTTDPNCLNPSDYHVTIDGQVGSTQLPGDELTLKPQHVSHGLQDTYSARVGGSYSWPVSEYTIVARGGVGYDTAAAKTGWERADLDGAARTMISAGGSFKIARWSIDAGFGVILEGTRTQKP